MTAQTDQSRPTIKLLCCTNERLGTAVTCCGRRRAHETLAALQQGIIERGLQADVSVEESVCLAHCRKGPNVRWVGHDLFHDVTTDKVREILDIIQLVLNSRQKAANKNKDGDPLSELSREFDNE